MAKQRKLQYPSSPNSFFEEMEQEMNSTKRKKCPKVPPEKLFLQFDPSKMERICSSEKKTTSQPSEIQKTQWKPPIKALCQPERLNSGKVMTSNDRSWIVEQINPKPVEQLATNNLEKTKNDSDEKKSKNSETDENSMDYDEVITINSSQESTDHNSPETLPRTIKETTEMLPLDPYPRNVLIHCEQNLENCTFQKENMEKSPTNKLTNAELGISDKHSSISQDIDDAMSESKNIIGKNRCVLSIDSLDKEKLSPAENAVREQLSNDFDKENINDNNLNQTQCSEVLDNNKIDLREIELDLSNETTNLKIPYEPQTVNKSTNNGPKQNEKPVELKVIFESTDSQTEINTLENFKQINVNTLSATDTFSANKSSNISGDKKLVLNDMNVTNIVQIGSVFSNSSPVEINESRNYEAAQEQEDNSNIIKYNDLQCSRDGLMSDNLCTIKDAESEVQNELTKLNQNLYVMVGNSMVSNMVCDETSKHRVNMVNNLEVQIPDSNVNNSAEDEIDAIKVVSHGSTDSKIHNNDKTEKMLTVMEDGEEEEEDSDENTNDECEQLLKVEEKIHKEMEMDEEYTCMMISNSQLLEIEKNYYEASKISPAKEVSKFSEYDCVKSNNFRSGNGITDSNSRKKGEKSENESCIDNHTDSGIQISSSLNLLNIPPNFPQVKWPQNVLEMKNKIRNLTVEIDQLNAMLMKLRQEIWPQRHTNNEN